MSNNRYVEAALIAPLAIIPGMVFAGGISEAEASDKLPIKQLSDDQKGKLKRAFSTVAEVSRVGLEARIDEIKEGSRKAFDFHQSDAKGFNLLLSKAPQLNPLIKEIGLSGFRTKIEPAGAPNKYYLTICYLFRDGTQYPLRIDVTDNRK